MQLDHINIKAPVDLMEAEKRFYCDLLGLREGPRPNFGSHGYWLYSGENALVHLSLGDASPEASGNGYFDHVAFRHVGLAACKTRLEDSGIDYSSHFIAERKLTQLFLQSPAGVRIEINFVDEQN